MKKSVRTKSHPVRPELVEGRTDTPTPFQQKVYAVVRRIPKGQVRSYAQVARAIGNPKAARAVGQALKRNRWPTEIPCHRVIASDGSSGGYAWGAAAKHRLLRREGAALDAAPKRKI